MTAAEYNTASDEELLARIARSDERAFDTLVRRHRGRILNLIYRSLGDRNQAEDVAQEVFLRVWRAAKDFEPKAKFTTWIYRIAVNVCLDTVKSAHYRQSFVQLDAEQPDEAGRTPRGDAVRSPEGILLAEEETRRIFAALQGLPANQRLAVILKKFDGLSYEEIGRVLGCSQSAVESLLVRAKRTLRDKLIPPGS